MSNIEDVLILTVPEKKKRLLKGIVGLYLAFLVIDVVVLTLELINNSRDNNTVVLFCILFLAVILFNLYVNTLQLMLANAVRVCISKDGVEGTMAAQRGLGTEQFHLQYEDIIRAYCENNKVLHIETKAQVLKFEVNDAECAAQVITQYKKTVTAKPIAAEEPRL